MLGTPGKDVAVIIPAALAAVVGILGVPAAPWPTLVLADANLVLGLQIGGNFDAAIIKQLSRLGWFVLLSNVFLLVVSALLAACLMPLLKIDLLSAYLAATPFERNDVIIIRETVH
jgi:uncharacterized membrane protein AbrB (regulator of aidB expression)